MNWLRSFGDYLVRVTRTWIWVVGFVTAIIGLWALQESRTVVLPTTAWVVLTVAILFIAQFLAFAEYRHEMERKRVTTPEGRRAMADLLVYFHGRGVSALQSGPNAGWQNEQQMADWLTDDGYWQGELVATIRERGLSHPEIHSIGVLGPPQHLPAGYAVRAAAGQPFLANRDFYQSLLAERLHRINALMKKYAA